MFVEFEKANHPIATMCRVLGVSDSGYYAWRKRGASERALAEAALLVEIRAIHTDSRGTYGAPRIHAELSARGIACSKKRVARLMRQEGLEGVSRRKKRGTTKRAPGATPAPDLVTRIFRCGAPDVLWVADITYLPTTGEGDLYLAAVIDAFSRRVVGWSMADHLRTELVLAAFEMAIERRRPRAGLIHHSDQGCQYTSLAFGARCEEAGILPSMGSVGDALDNALCESFFATLECELIDRSSWRTRDEARVAVFDYIEGFYNLRRRHSSLDYLSPVEYERRWLSQRPAA